MVHKPGQDSSSNWLYSVLTASNEFKYSVDALLKTY